MGDVVWIVNLIIVVAGLTMSILVLFRHLLREPLIVTPDVFFWCYFLCCLCFIDFLVN